MPAFIAAMTSSRLWRAVTMRMVCHAVLAWILWHQGYPEQALKKKPEAFTLAQELSHPLSLTWAYDLAAKLHLWCREGPAVIEQAKAMLQLADEHDMPYWLTEGAMMQGWARVEQGQVQEGIRRMRQGLADWRHGKWCGSVVFSVFAS